MRCLSVKQPWASLIACGEKSVELRTWATTYRGPLLIVSSVARADADADERARAWGAVDGPRGCALALVELVDVRPATHDDAHEACARVARGEFAWVLRRARTLNPRPLKGRLGLYAPPPGFWS